MSRHVEPPAESPDASLERIEMRIAGRQMAKQLYELCDGPITNFHYVDSLVQELKRLAGLYEPEPVPETRGAIARLGREKMPFGIHADKCLDDVPLEYLDWLCRSQESFYKNLRAYLKHPELESRRSGEIGEPI